MDGPEALILAFAGGVLSFLSPCTLPLLPGYLAYMSGLGVEEVQAREHAHTVVAAAGLFVLGFSLVFVSLGATASYIGTLLLPNKGMFVRIAGVFIVLTGLVMVGWVQAPLLYREKRFHVGRDWGMWSAFPLGMAFAFGWTPCIGLILTPIMALAATDSSVRRGALLLLLYSFGLGLPFVAVALFAERAFRSLGWFKRHFRALNVTGGTVLVVMGVYMALDQWTQLLQPLMRWYAQFNLPS